MNRVHRVGQRHAVRVTRLVVRGTVEEKILQLQERKRSLCCTALALGSGEEGDGSALGKQAERQLRLKDLALCFE